MKTSDYSYRAGQIDFTDESRYTSEPADWKTVAEVRLSIIEALRKSIAEHEENLYAASGVIIGLRDELAEIEKERNDTMQERLAELEQDLQTTADALGHRDIELAAVTKERDGWKDEAAAQKMRASSYVHVLELRQDYEAKDVWFWSGDGCDHLESMSNTMTVVITAGELRILLRNQLAASQARERQLREALAGVESAYGAHITDTVSAMKLIAKNVLALPNDTSALDALTKDAERYRWLRQMVYDETIMVAPDRMLHGDELDAAIDAAMKLGTGDTTPDLNTCPQCGGPADNGHDRCVPPSNYLCSKCQGRG